MKDYPSLGEMEARFAEIIWNTAPVSSSELVRRAKEELNWARTTTHTVIRKLCEKGLFVRDAEGIVRIVLSRDEYYSGRGRQFVNIAYDGSLPMFIAGFVKKQKLSEKDIDEIIELLNKKR